MIIEQGVITIGLVVIVFAVTAVAVGIVLWVKAEIAKVDDDAAGQAATLARELSDYKLHVAETYMSKASGGMAIDRAVTEIKGLRVDLKDEMGKLGTRIERMENHVLARVSSAT